MATVSFSLMMGTLPGKQRIERVSGIPNTLAVISGHRWSQDLGDLVSNRLKRVLYSMMTGLAHSRDSLAFGISVGLLEILFCGYRDIAPDSPRILPARRSVCRLTADGRQRQVKPLSSGQNIAATLTIHPFGIVKLDFLSVFIGCIQKADNG